MKGTLTWPLAEQVTLARTDHRSPYCPGVGAVVLVGAQCLQRLFDQKSVPPTDGRWPSTCGKGKPVACAMMRCRSTSLRRIFCFFLVRASILVQNFHVLARSQIHFHREISSSGISCWEVWHGLLVQLCLRVRGGKPSKIVDGLGSLRRKLHRQLGYGSWEIGPETRSANCCVGGGIFFSLRESWCSFGAGKGGGSQEAFNFGFACADDVYCKLCQFRKLMCMNFSTPVARLCVCVSDGNWMPDSWVCGFWRTSCVNSDEKWFALQLCDALVRFYVRCDHLLKYK